MVVKIVAMNYFQNTITLMTTEDFAFNANRGMTTQSCHWTKSLLRSYLQTNKNDILPELHPYLVQIKNYTQESDPDRVGSYGHDVTPSDDYLFPPSVRQLGYTNSAENSYSSPFPYFSSASKRIIKDTEYATRSSFLGQGAENRRVATATVKSTGVGQNYQTIGSYPYPLCFCIG